MGRHALLAGLATLVVLGASAAGASALENPELLYREGVSENEPLGPWLPLDGAHIAGLGFIVGTRQQAKPAQDSAVLHRLTALSVPDGHPDQGTAFDPARLCISSARTPGSEIALGTGRFEGPGSYTIKLDVDVPSNGATNSSCSGGPSSTATFTIDPVVTLSLLATAPVVVPRPHSLARIATILVTPAGGQGETQCARDAAIAPDGSVTGVDRTPLLGFSVIVKQIPRSGRWTCVGRVRGAATDAADGEHYTRWSAPVSFDAVSDFSAKLSVPDGKPKRYTVAYSKLPSGSQGAKVTLRISPGTGCPKVATKTLRATVGANLAVRFTFTLPEKRKAKLGRPGIDSYGWRYRLDFGGTRLVRPGRLAGSAFVNPARFTDSGGHVLHWGQEVKAFCTRTA